MIGFLNNAQCTLNTISLRELSKCRKRLLADESNRKTAGMLLQGQMTFNFDFANL
jgi:hypothetical protein